MGVVVQEVSSAVRKVAREVRKATVSGHQRAGFDQKLAGIVALRAGVVGRVVDVWWGVGELVVGELVVGTTFHLRGSS